MTVVLKHDGDFVSVIGFHCSKIQHIFFFTINSHMFRTEQSIVGLTQDLSTSTIKLQAENTVNLCVYCGTIRHIDIITMELQ